jgi:hypothetical protein
MNTPATYYPFPHCRAITGHQWSEQPDVLVKAPPHIAARFGWTMECRDCGTVKTVWYDRKGNPVHSRYQYPEGYATKLERREVRVAFVKERGVKP